MKTPVNVSTWHAAAPPGGEVSISIRDEGQGFGSSGDPTAVEDPLFTEGRGIYLMKILMDEVRFEENGAVVRMSKSSNACPTGRKPQEISCS
jgi:anti-sigma regulatory factor (Ser/Thr protein kinase)